MHLTRGRIALVLAAAALALAVPLASGGLGAVGALAAFPVGHALAAALLALGATCMRAGKLHALSTVCGPDLRIRDALGVAFGGDFCFLASPAGLAGPPGTVLLLHRAGLPTGVATALVVADQALDAIVFAVTIPVVLAVWAGAGDRVLPPATLVPWLAALVVAIVAIVAMRRCWTRIGAAGGRLARHGLRRDAMRGWRARCQRLIAILAESRQALVDLGRASVLLRAEVVALTALQWALRYAVLAVVLDAFGVWVPWAYLILAQALVAHAGQWTGVPGAAGVTELGMASALDGRLPAPSIAAAILVWRLLTLHLPLCIGAGAFFVMARAGRHVPAVSGGAPSATATLRLPPR